MITANQQQPALTPPAQGGTAYDMSAGLLGGAADVYKKMATGGGLQNINAYLNPFYDQVISSTFDRMDVGRDKTLGMIGDSAIASGAFGGSRHGVMEGEFLGQDQMNRADMAARLMAQNFDQASTSARSDMFGAAQGATQLGGMYYDVGNNIADRQMQSGTMQQQLMQQLLDATSGKYGEMVQHPYKILDLLNAMTAGDPRNNAGSKTQSTTPGLFDYLSLAAGLGGVAMETYG